MGLIQCPRHGRVGLQNVCPHIGEAVDSSAAPPARLKYYFEGLAPPGPTMALDLCQQCATTFSLPLPPRPVPIEELERVPTRPVCHLCFTAARGELYVRHLSVEVPPGGRGEAIGDPTVAQVLQAVDELDGDVRTLVVLTGQDETLGSMNIGGGGDGRCMVGIVGAKVQRRVVHGSGTSRMPCVIGGQGTEIEERYLVPRAIALQAAERYVRWGDADETLTWESEAW